MGFDYLGGKNWKDVTRDERTFCADLYMLLQDNKKLANFTSWLIKECKLDSIENLEQLEVGFEVTFVRDVLFDYEVKTGNRAPQKEDIKGVLKRTFDLAIFLPNDLIIIEAKAAESLKSKQMSDFLKDEKAIQYLLEAINPKATLNVHLVGLVSPEYSYGESTRKLFNNRIINWKDLESSGIGYKMPKMLERIYTATQRVKRMPLSEENSQRDLVKKLKSLYRK